MKTRLYRAFVRFACGELYYHRLLREKDGKYRLAARVWNYRKLYPDSTNWVSGLVDDFKRRYVVKYR